MSDFLPDNDADLALARKIGDLLERQAPISASELGEARFHAAVEQIRRDARVPEPRSDVMWDRIAARTHESKAPRIVRHPALWRWAAVAATVLVAGSLAWMLMTRPAVESLIAAADAAVYEYVDAEGTTISLRPNSRLYTVRTPGPDVAYRIDGEAFFDVVRNETRTFSVRAGDVSVSVLGTRFNASTWGEKVQVFVADGRVKVEDRSALQSAVLAAGEWAGVTPDGSFLMEFRSADESLDWLTGELVFEQRSVGTIIAELEHHFRIDVDVPEHMARETITGRVFLDAPDQSLNDLGLVLGGSFHQTNTRSYRFSLDE